LNKDKISYDLSGDPNNILNILFENHESFNVQLLKMWINPKSTDKQSDINGDKHVGTTAKYKIKHF
jgi:hypothetical protein